MIQVIFFCGLWNLIPTKHPIIICNDSYLQSNTTRNSQFLCSPIWAHRSVSTTLSDSLCELKMNMMKRVFPKWHKSQSHALRLMPPIQHPYIYTILWQRALWKCFQLNDSTKKSKMQIVYRKPLWQEVQHCYRLHGKLTRVSVSVSTEMHTTWKRVVSVHPFNNLWPLSEPQRLTAYQPTLPLKKDEQQISFVVSLLHMWKVHPVRITTRGHTLLTEFTVIVT